MNLPTDQREIEALLTTFAQKVSGEAERVQWYTEFHPSTHYRLSGVLVFTPAESREQELAAVSVQLNDQTGWMFDATDQASIIMAEASVAGSADSATVVDTLSAFLDEAEPLVAAALQDS